MRRSFLAMSLLCLASACATAPRAVPEPRPEASAAPASEAFRQQPPEPGEPPELVLPRFERATLDNGLTVLVSTRQELPLVYTGVAFAAGSAQDPKGKGGLAEMTYEMLLEGAAGRDTLALDRAFQDLGVSPSASVHPDGASIGVRVLRRNVDEALALLSDVVRRPDFRREDFERRKELQLSELVRQSGNPGFLARQAYLKAVFGEEHPYGHPVSGALETVGSVTLPDVKRFYQENVGPKAAALVMAGDITLEEAVELARRSFGDWEGEATLPPVPPEPPALPREQVLFVPRPGLEQTVVVVGRPGVAV
ncbi:MAG TPA: pitrilysin family protein, partial [Myxococcaceae bacterium]|nr:pitrilysin family protein [Myxococcaceae bacterium]